MSSSLYICYFGVLQPLVQTQVIPYLLELMRRGDAETPGRGDLNISVSLLTFEPAAEKGRRGDGEKGSKQGRKTEFAAIREKLAAEGIDWHWLTYHKRPSAIATAYDVLRGAWFIRRVIARDKVDILHGRVHIPTLMGAIARKFSRRKPKLLFDIRGFFPEEYTDAGIWPENGWLYRAAKRVERWLMKEADGFVVLTEKARDILFPESKDTGFDKLERPVEVIPCCVDFQNRFSVDRLLRRDETRRKLGVENRFVFTHVGALGGLYLTEQIVDFLQMARLRDPGSFALFLTQSDPNLIVPLLRQRGFDDIDYFVGRVAPANIPEYLSASDAGLSFVKAGYATQSRSPTKIPEYLACGLPIIANAGIGDVDELIVDSGVGVLVKEFSRESYLEVLQGIEMLGDIGDRCRETAIRKFDLEKVGGDKYRRIYGRLLEKK